MSMIEIQQSAGSLTKRERGGLALWLLDSLPPHGDEDASAESTREAAHRRDELDSGQTRALGSADFWDSVQRERGAWR